MMPHLPERVESFELNTAFVNVQCTLGKLTIWFGRQASMRTILNLLYAITRVKTSIFCEIEINCPYEKIAYYESHGLLVASYARVGRMYKVNLIVQFTNPLAIHTLAEAIFSSLKKSSATIVLYWLQGEPVIYPLYRELSIAESWESKSIKYREEIEE